MYCESFLEVVLNRMKYVQFHSKITSACTLWCISEDSNTNGAVLAEYFKATSDIQWQGCRIWWHQCVSLLSSLATKSPYQITRQMAVRRRWSVLQRQLMVTWSTSGDFQVLVVTDVWRMIKIKTSFLSDDLWWSKDIETQFCQSKNPMISKQVMWKGYESDSESR